MHMYCFDFFSLSFLFPLSAHLQGAAKGAASAGRRPEAAKGESSERLQDE